MNDQPIEYYELRKVTIQPIKPGEFRMATAAVMSCGFCGGCISGNGGPGRGNICVRCAEVVQKGNARGAIKWDEP